MVRYPASADRVNGVTVKRTFVKEHKEYGKGGGQDGIRFYQLQFKKL